MSKEIKDAVPVLDNGEIIELTYPIKVEMESVPKLVLRRPKARDLSVMDSEKGDIGKAIVLIARLAGIPKSSVGQIDGGDFKKLQEVIESFLDNSP